MAKITFKASARTVRLIDRENIVSSKSMLIDTNFNY